MAEKKAADAKEPAPAPKEEPKKTVVFRLPLLPDGKNAPKFVSVNGQTWLVKRGVDVEMPLEVYEVLRNQEKALMEAYRQQEALQAK